MLLVSFHGEHWHIKLFANSPPKLNYCFAYYIYEVKILLFWEDKKNHGELNDTGETDGVKRTDRYIIANFECFICGRHCAKHFSGFSV